jgi:hypothetical protein
MIRSRGISLFLGQTRTIICRSNPEAMANAIWGTKVACKEWRTNGRQRAFGTKWHTASDSPTNSSTHVAHILSSFRKIRQSWSGIRQSFLRNSRPENPGSRVKRLSGEFTSPYQKTRPSDPGEEPVNIYRTRIYRLEDQIAKLQDRARCEDLSTYFDDQSIMLYTLDLEGAKENKKLSSLDVEGIQELTRWSPCVTPLRPRWNTPESGKT